MWCVCMCVSACVYLSIEREKGLKLGAQQGGGNSHGRDTIVFHSVACE